MDFSDYKGIYVIGALLEGHIQKVTGELIGQARQLADTLDETVEVILVGADLKDDPKDLIPLGADHVYVMTDERLSHYDGKAYQKVLADFLKDRKPDTIIFAATAFGRDLAPRLAAELICGVTADVTELSAEKDTKLVIWSRPAMDGNIVADIVSPAFRPQVGTVRPGIFKSPIPDMTRTGTVEQIPVTLAKDDIGSILLEVLKAEEEDNTLETAKIIVAGGRGIRTKEEWDTLYDLGKLLNAAVGCTRPISEIGWEPHHHQIGQTGKGIAPKVYFALGISGAMQHMCAVNADIIIAVNKDPNAPIMEMADYAVVADLKEFLPRLIKKLTDLKANKE